MDSAWIYHLAPSSELHAGCTADSYAPARLPEDGFVHCAGSMAVALSVAGDYYADVDEPLHVLAIDPAKLSAELRFEAPAPIAGGGRAHLDKASHFPHVYGAIDRGAIVEVGTLAKTGGGFGWPAGFEPLDELLSRA
jgi:uncharacterized protein (DUF952 family)